MSCTVAKHKDTALCHLFMRSLFSLFALLHAVVHVNSFRIDVPLSIEEHSANSVSNSTTITSDIFKKNSRSQWFEDTYLYNNYFYGITEGLIVESGAFDGLTFSTSFTFQKLLDWTAVHVEGKLNLHQCVVWAMKESLFCIVLKTWLEKKSLLFQS